MSNKAIPFLPLRLISQLRASPAKRPDTCKPSSLQVLPVEPSQTLLVVQHLLQSLSGESGSPSTVHEY